MRLKELTKASSTSASTSLPANHSSLNSGRQYKYTLVITRILLCRHFPSAIRHLSLEQLQRVQPYLRLRHLQTLPENRARFVLNQQQVSVCFRFDNLLHYPQEVYRREEIPRREVGDGVGGRGAHAVVGVGRLIALGALGFLGLRDEGGGFGGGGAWWGVAEAADGGWGAGFVVGAFVRGLCCCGGILGVVEAEAEEAWEYH